MSYTLKIVVVVVVVLFVQVTTAAQGDGPEVNVDDAGKLQQMTDIVGKMEGRLQLLEDRNDALEAKGDGPEVNVDDAGRLKQMTDIVVKMERRLQLLEDRNDQLEAEVNFLQNMNEQLEAKGDGPEVNVDDAGKIEGRLQLLEDRNDQLDALEAEVNFLQNRNEQLESQMELILERDHHMQEENHQLRNAAIGQSRRLDTLESFAEVLYTTPVAFSAVLTGGWHTYVAGETVVFDYMYTNAGEAYNSTSGIFTCPHAALYLFTVTIRSNDEGALVYVYMDEDRVGQLYAAGRDSAQDVTSNMVSNTIILQCNKDSEVKAVIADSSKNMLYGGYYTTFTGTQVHYLF